MDEPRGRYQVERVVAAWTKAAELIDDPCFGLEVVDAWSSADLYVLGGVSARAMNRIEKACRIYFA